MWSEALSTVEALADMVEAIATPDPKVVAMRQSMKVRQQRLRLLRMVRATRVRLARLQQLRGKPARAGRVAALQARRTALDAELTAMEVNG